MAEKDAESTGGDEDVQEAKREYSLDVDTWDVNRKSAVDDLRFGRLGEQWPENIRQDRQLAGRPVLTINKMPAFIRQVVNDARQNRPSIDVKPVDGGADIQTAQIFAGIIRNIEYQSNADVAYDTGIDYAASCGFGFWRVNLDYESPRSFSQQISIAPIYNPLTVVMPSDAKGSDSAEWKRCFVSEIIEKEEFEELYPGARSEGFGEGDEYDTPWWDSASDGVRVAEYFKRREKSVDLVMMSNGMILDGDVLAGDEMLRAAFDAQGVGVVGQRKAQDYEIIHQVITGAEVLEETMWPGRYIPIVPCFGEDINVEGRRYLRSLIRDARDPQQIYNYWRSTSTELLALSPKVPWIGPKGAFKTDAEKWGTANTRNHSTLEYDGQTAPQRVPFDPMPAGAIHESLTATDDIKAVLGMYDASLGQRSNETSGRAIMFRQREGDTSTYHFIDNLTRAIRCTGKILIDMIPRVYTEARVIRILGDNMKPHNVQIGPAQQGAAPPGAQQPGQPEQQQEGMERVYDLNAGNYDVAVTAGPSFTTKREETAAQIIEFLRVFPQAAPMMGDILAKNLDWKGADQLAERLAMLLPPEARGEQAQQGPDPEVMAMQARTQSEIAAGQMKTQAEIEQINAKTMAKMENDRQIANQKMAQKRDEAVLDALIKVGDAVALRQIQIQ